MKLSGFFNNSIFPKANKDVAKTTYESYEIHAPSRMICAQFYRNVTVQSRTDHV